MTAKTANEIKSMEKAGRLAAEVLQVTGKAVRAGVTTNELDKIAHDFILSRNAIPACLGYYGYQKTICTSLNDVICHGVPDDRALREGDILNIDVTVIVEGFHGDTSAMFFVGDVSDRAKKISACAYDAMMKGIEQARAGARTGDIGFAIDKFVKRQGYKAVREVGGHGIGRVFHEPPFIPSFGKKHHGDLLVKWGTITVEPMVNETEAPVIEEKIPGSEILLFRTSDKSLSAQYEHTVLITDAGSEILTQI